MTEQCCDNPDLCAYEVSKDGVSIRFLPCGRISYNPHDVINRYCGACHRFITNRMVTPYGEVWGFGGSGGSVSAGQMFAHIIVYGTSGADCLSGDRADMVIVDEVADWPAQQSGPPMVTPVEKAVLDAMGFGKKDDDET